MTEHEKDKAAYEACGYYNVKYDEETQAWYYEHIADGGKGGCPMMLAPWSSADAAIEHAERGGFSLQITIIGSRRQVSIRHDSRGDTLWCEWTTDPPGLAIRNSILNSPKDPMKNAVSIDELGIDWNRVEKHKTRLVDLPVIGDPITDMENDLTNRKRSS